MTRASLKVATSFHLLAPLFVFLPFVAIKAMKEAFPQNWGKGQIPSHLVLCCWLLRETGSYCIPSRCCGTPSSDRVKGRISNSQISELKARIALYYMTPLSLALISLFLQS